MVSGKKFMTESQVVYPVGVTKCEKPSMISS